MAVCSFPAGRVLFSEGDPSDRAYLLRSGRVEIVKNTERGSVRLAVLSAGDLVGEMGLLEERPRSATARALDDVTADAVLPGELVGRLFNEPAACVDLLRALFERLRSTNQMLSDQVALALDASPLPSARILPASTAALRALPEQGLEITRFPYRVGRAPTDRTSEVLSFNDLEIQDGESSTLSPNHFALDLAESGVIVRDRGSRLGTLVNGVAIGALGKSDVAALRSGDNEIVPGARRAPRRDDGTAFRFKVTVT